jgi:uncharacterized protein DUF1501
MTPPRKGQASAPCSRRQFLSRSAQGFGALAATALFAEDASGLARPTPHHRARAKSIVFLYMDGGPSQVDTFDPKPRLAKEHGQPFGLKMEPTQFNDNGTTLKSPWKFRHHGESGLEISSLFPHLAKRADELCVIRSMVSEFSEHTNANYFLHTGLGLAGRPSMGAWVSYGLGQLNRDLPGFVVLNGGLIPPGGLDCFGSGFLPARVQGSVLRPQSPALSDVVPREESSRQRRKLDLIAALDRRLSRELGRPDALESAIENQELAFRMQAAVPELTNLDRESAATRKLYGLDAEYAPTRSFGAQCLLARRMVERGVRFVELTCPAIGGADRWDQHQNLERCHADNARAVDQPIAGLLRDLRGRGLLDETLVVFAGEFGRTPFAQGTNGRDHNPFGYSIWLAGGGVRGGMSYGATDEYGYHAVERRTEIYDLHATMLHLLGFDHTRLTVRHSGRDMRLTDVHGRVIHDIFRS